MDTIEKILKYIRMKRAVSGKEIADYLGVSRQAVNKHLKALIQKGKVIKEGTTRGAVYKIAGKIKPPKRLRKKYLLENLEEDKVFKEVELLLNLRKSLRQNVYDIMSYAFTEVLNNAIEHSQSKNCEVVVALDQYTCNFTIRDNGIGIFYSIYTKFNLPDEASAIGELIKGKTTTMKERHSGEGVFFISKSGDDIVFRSHKVNLIFDNIKRDVFVQERKFQKGTEVAFSISRASKRELEKIFKKYAPEEFDYNFEKTRVFVKLFQEEYISRSEAKRMLSGLDKFKEIILDFKGVKTIGQGFVDEIFRVFQRQHPDIIIKTENLNSHVAMMIKHVVDNKI
jgi:biotin operon repressor/anti-sigma regulatory factor (Ser/Thr protein kinase)